MSKERLVTSTLSHIVTELRGGRVAVFDLLDLIDDLAQAGCKDESEEQIDLCVSLIETTIKRDPWRVIDARVFGVTLAELFYWDAAEHGVIMGIAGLAAGGEESIARQSPRDCPRGRPKRESLGRVAMPTIGVAWTQAYKAMSAASPLGSGALLAPSVPALNEAYRRNPYEERAGFIDLAPFREAFLISPKVEDPRLVWLMIMHRIMSGRWPASFGAPQHGARMEAARALFAAVATVSIPTPVALGVTPAA